MPTGIITGQILTPDGQPAAGAPVRLTPHVRHLTTAEAVVLPSPIDVCADAAGQIRVTVVATDTMPGVEWGWLVSAESWTASTVPMWLQVPTRQTVDLVADGRVIDVTDPARPIMKGEAGVGIDTITAADGIATITLTNGSTRTIDLPPGADGHTPVVGLDGDRLTVDGVPVGDSLRGPAGHSPEVVVDGDIITIDGQSTDPLASTIPGPPTTLTVGEVATLPPSSPATAQIIGEPPSQTLTLGIPRGEVGPASTVPGPPGAIATASTYLIVGPGRPDVPATTGGIITGSEPVGAEYRSTDGAGVGAWVWMKRSTGWVVTDGDTGWRDVSALFTGITTGGIDVLREGNWVYWRARNLITDTTTNGVIVPEPTGFVAATTGGGWQGGLFVPLSQLQGWVPLLQLNRFIHFPRIALAHNGQSRIGVTRPVRCTQPWPTTLPGTPI